MDPITIALLASTAASGLGSYFGGKKASKAQQNALLEARAESQRGYDEASGTRRDYLGRAGGYMQPMMTGGDAAREQYETAMGLRGADAQRAYYQNFQHDPGFESELAGGVSAMDRSAARRGGLYSGAQMAGVHRYGQQMTRDAYGRRMAGYNSLMGTGDNARMTMAGMTDRAGSDLASMRMSHADNMSNSMLKGGQLKAEGAMAPWNALSSTVGNMGKIYAGMPSAGPSAPSGPSSINNYKNGW
jgi:hypothetical protein